MRTQSRFLITDVLISVLIFFIKEGCHILLSRCQSNDKIEHSFYGRMKILLMKSRQKERSELSNRKH